MAASGEQGPAGDDGGRHRDRAVVAGGAQGVQELCPALPGELLQQDQVPQVRFSHRAGKIPGVGLDSQGKFARVGAGVATSGNADKVGEVA